MTVTTLSTTSTKNLRVSEALVVCFYKPQRAQLNKYTSLLLAGTTLLKAMTVPAARSKTNLLKLQVPILKTNGNVFETKPVCLLDIMGRINATFSSSSSSTYKAAKRIIDASEILGADFCFKVKSKIWCDVFILVVIGSVCSDSHSIETIYSFRT